MRVGPIEINWARTKTGLAKATIQFAVAEGLSPGAGVISAIVLKNVNLAEGEKATAEAKVQLCVNRAIVHAVLETFADANEEPDRVREVCNSVEPTIIPLGDLDSDFLEQPETIPVWDLVRDGVELELEDAGIEQKRWPALCGPLPDRFVIALHMWWRKMKLDGDTPRALGVTPGLGPAKKRAEAWRAIEDGLIDWPLEPKNNFIFRDRELFPNPFGIAKIYVRLRGYEIVEGWRGGHDADATESQQGTSDKPVARQVDLHGAIDAWLDGEGDGSSIRFVSGGPGSGKSTFARMLAAERAADPDWRVLFVQLHTLTTKDRWKQIVKKLHANRSVANEMMDRAAETRHLLFILDGLDELATLGPKGLEKADGLVAEIEGEVAELNGAGPRARALFLGRDIAVQASESSSFRKASTLHVMPLSPPDSLLEKMVWRGGQPDSQLLGCWTRNLDAVGVKTHMIPEGTSASASIRDLVATPVSNALLARYLAARPDAADRNDGLPRLANLSQADLYFRIIEDIHRRDWVELKGLKLNALSKFASFMRFLEDVALACFRDSSRAATVETIAGLISDQALREDLRRAAKARQDVPEQALLAFHFKFQGRASDRRIEFTHKSFADYLLARRLLRAAREKVGLAEWARLFSTVRVAPEIVPLLRAEGRRLVAGDIDLEPAGHYLADLLTAAVREGIPLGAWTDGAESGTEIGNRVTDAELALLATLDAICRSLETSETPVSALVGWPDEWAAWRLITRQIGRAYAEEGATVRSTYRICVGRLRYVEANLYDLDPEVVALGSTRELDADATAGQQLESLDLRDADFSDANLGNAELRSANLRSAILRSAILINAILDGADLGDADLSGANLRTVTLRAAILNGAILDNADLRDATLSDADLRGATLSGADLSDATLSGADLRNCFGGDHDTGLRAARNLGRAIMWRSQRLALGLEPGPNDVQDPVKGAGGSGEEEGGPD